MKAKFITMLLATVAAAVAQQGVTVNHDGAVVTQLGQSEARQLVITGGGQQSTAPAISFVNHGQGIFCAAIGSGGICSFYRKVNGEAREWLRIGPDGIQLVDDNGLVPALTGAPRPGCVVDHLYGFAIEKCP